ncbi:hypothetical protein KAT92_02530 [Candidatus Babeliales bacterium]|nr:hypothetical protein [Candidatus Babeliales bacterium]
MKKLNNFLLTLFLLVAGGASVVAMEIDGLSPEEQEMIARALSEAKGGDQVDVAPEVDAQPVVQAPAANPATDFDVVNHPGLKQQFGTTCGVYALYHAYLLAHSNNIETSQAFLSDLVGSQILSFTQDASGGDLNSMLLKLVSTGFLRESQVHIVDSAGFESVLSSRCVSPLENSIVNLSLGQPLVLVFNTTITSNPENVDHWIAVRVDLTDGRLLLTVVNSGQGTYTSDNQALQGLIRVIRQELINHGLLPQAEVVQSERTQTATEESRAEEAREQTPAEINADIDVAYKESLRIDEEKEFKRQEEQASIASEQAALEQQERDRIAQQLRDTQEYDALIVQLAKAGNDRSKIGKICNQIAPADVTNGEREKGRVARQVAGVLARGNATIAQIQDCFPNGMCSEARAQRFLDNYAQA